MRNWMKLAALPLMFVMGLVLVQAPVASEGEKDAAPALVDYRMAPLEQVKKINRHMRDRNGAGETMTVMNWDGVAPPGQSSSGILRQSGRLRGQDRGDVQERGAWRRRQGLRDHHGSCRRLEDLLG